MEFWNELFNQGIRYVISGVVALGCILLGIFVRKRKDARETNN